MCDTKGLAVGQQTGDSWGTSTSREPQARGRFGGLARHLEGWQLGLLAVGVACVATWLALPRPVEPALLPLPEIDRLALSRAVAADSARVVGVLGRPLPYEVRTLGEAIRDHGVATLDDAGLAAETRADAQRLSRLVLAKHGAEALLTLRALQAQLFLDAVARWQASGKVERELSELSGNFPEKSRANAWVDSGGRLRLTRDELRVLFKLRWSDLTGTRERRELRPTLDEFRLYYSVLLRYPSGESAHERDEHRLAAVRTLARIDDAFPADLASGVLGYRLGRLDAALGGFRAHLTAHPSGPWALRARNHALYVAAALPPEQ